MHLSKKKWITIAVGAFVAVAPVAIALWIPDEWSPWAWAGGAAIVVVSVAFWLGSRDGRYAAREARLVGSFMLVSPLLVALFLVPTALQLMNGSHGTCDNIPMKPSDTQVEGKPKVSDTLEIQDPAAARISLGDGPGPAKVPVMLKIQPVQSTAPTASAQPKAASPKEIQVNVDQLRRGGDPDVVVAVKAGAEFTSPVAARLWICVQRESEVRTNDAAGSAATPGFFKLDPGEYSGSITIIDPRLPTTTVPFTVAVAFPNWAMVLIVGCIVVCVGGVFIAITREDPEGKGNVGFRLVATFLGTWAGIAAFVVGAGAAFVAYMSTYLNNNAWGAAASEWLALIGAMFTAFVASASAFRFARVLKDSAADEAVAGAKDGMEAEADVKAANDNLSNAKKHVAAAEAAVEQATEEAQQVDPTDTDGTRKAQEKVGKAEGVLAQVKEAQDAAEENARQAERVRPAAATRDEALEKDQRAEDAEAAVTAGAKKR